MIRECLWCRRPMPAGRRTDARYCSKPCRQAAHRASIGRASTPLAEHPLRLAYADPPYPGKSDLYRGHPDYAGEVDHRALLEELRAYDGWILHTSSDALPMVYAIAMSLGLFPRCAAWVKPWTRPHPVARIRDTWEPVLYAPARNPSRGDREQTPNALIGPTPRARETLPSYVIGAKPPAVAAWAFELVGAAPGDELVDMFPGSGLVMRTWRVWCGLEPHPIGGLEGWQLELEATGVARVDALDG